MPLALHSYPRAILHIDGDSFFAACEVAVNPALRGKPIVTGKERGIASSISYELKAMGVKRGMMLSEIKKICPDVIIVPSDYETYSLFSTRMYSIVRRYTDAVEEYSTDECFADLTGMRRTLRMSYEDMAAAIKHDLDTELGITFSIGLGPNKIIAKIGSKWKKPSGLTLIPARKLEYFLRDLDIDKIWGIGPQTSAYLRQHRVYTALEYAKLSEDWIKAHMSKPYQEIWQELQGKFVLPLTIGEKHNYQSISKTKTFTPSSRDPEFIFSQLSKNIENACIKARRHSLAPKKVFFFIKSQDFSYSGLELTLSAPTAEPNEIVRLARESFHKVFNPRVDYRATGVVLMHLDANYETQLDLFGSVTRLSDLKPVYAAVDALDRKFGKHTVFLGSTMKAINAGAHMTDRGEVPGRSKNLLKGENKRQRIGIPLLGEVK